MLHSRETLLALAALANALSRVTAYTWPDPQTDRMEALLYEQVTNYNGVGMVSGVRGCGRRAADTVGPNEGRTNAAEWLRTAYHDMATADVSAGTGGLDASIGFEIADREENKGRAFLATLGFFNNHVTIRSSMADLIALGTIMTVGSCSNGSIIIPLRAGRVDALGPGPSGVPQPHEDLASHTESFARQGFNASEMAALVACGHAIGGVHGNDFPEIVPIVNDPELFNNRVNFDGTHDIFDNSVAKQFVSSVTQNPLAFGQNQTTNSDFRVFNVDGGSMIRRLAASSEFFFQTCGALIERMLNTVPSNVTLTDVIEPVKVKPIELDIDVYGNGTMTIRGQIRIMEDASTSSARKVFLDFKPHSPEQCSSTGEGPPCSFSTEVQYPKWTIEGLYPGVPRFTVYTFFTNIPASWGVSSFDVRMEDQSRTVTIDNGGNGFPVEDRMIQQRLTYCRVLQQIPRDMSSYNMTIAVRAANVNRLLLRAVEAIPQAGSPANVPRLAWKSFEMTKIREFNNTGYDLYQNVIQFRVPSNVIHNPTYDLVGTGPDGTIENTYIAFDSNPRFC